MGFIASLFGSSTSQDLMITDVTRMQEDRVCVAAIRGREAVRLSAPQPTDGLLAELGGLRPGDLVRVDWQREPRYRPPHKEDCRWAVSSFRKTGSLSGDELYERLLLTAQKSVRRAFGKPAFFSAKGNSAFPPGRGSRSLATIRAHEVKVYRLGEDLRADFRDADDDWESVPIEDLSLRIHLKSCRECRHGGGRITELCVGSALLRTGLTRPFQPDGQQSGCFLQINFILPPQGIPPHFSQGAHR